MLQQKCSYLIVALAIILNFIATYLTAQPSSLLEKDIVFSHLPEALGLSEPTINCILQDNEGYLWIGTWSGLIRYDGYTTKKYYSSNKSPHSLKSNKIISLLQDRRGNIWIGTHKGGLFKFDPATEQFIQYKHNVSDPNTISNDNVWALLEDQEGRIWIGTEHGLNIFNTEDQSFTRYFSNDDSTTLSHNFITDLHQSSSGKIWVATEYGFNQLVSFGKRMSFKRYVNVYGDRDRPLHNYIYQIDDIQIEGMETLLLASKKGLKLLSGDRITNHEMAEKASGYNLFRTILVVGGEQPYVLAGSEMGLNIFDPKRKAFSQLFLNDPGQANLTDGTVTSIYLDKTKVLWVGTKKGINKYDSYSKGFNFFTTGIFDPTESIITGIRESANGHYWIGTMGGGLFRFRNGEPQENNKALLFQGYNIRTDQKNDFTDFIQTLYTDTKGKVWIGTAGAGVYSFNESDVHPASREIRTYDHYYLQSVPKISDDYIMSFTEGQDGSMWVGTWSGGLNQISSNGTVTIYNKPFFSQAPVVALFEDSKKHIWAGTRGNGIFRINSRIEDLEVKPYNAEDGLGNLFVNAIYEDIKKTLWIGTEDGLYFLPDGHDKFKRYNFKAEMNAEVIVGILADKKERLWLSHWEGLTVIDPHEPTATMRHFDRQDHIQGGFFYNNSCVKNADGDLIFGGSNGFNIINPDKDLVNPFKPEVVIQEIQVNSQPLKNDKETPRSSEKQAAEDLILNYSENSLSFEFAALHFAAPNKITYAYKLDGFDEEWHYTGSDRRFVNYTNLPAGTYHLLVDATNNDGIWSKQYASFSFVVKPPWWKTKWAILVYITSFLVILLIFRKVIIIRTNLINNLKLEKLKRTSLENINKAKLEFFTNISHEFRTPLTLILGPLQRIKDAAIADRNVWRQLNIIDNNAQRLLRLVNQLLDFRKADSGNLKLQVAKGNILRFIHEVKLSFEGLADQQNIDFRLRSTEESVEIWFDRDQFEKILFNLIFNAFKNTPAGGIIDIEVSKAAGEVFITVTNNGKGIKATDLDQIFKRFYSGKDPDNFPGSGIGLALTKSLVEMHGGKIEVQSRENQFTSFLVKIPTGQDHFEPEHLLSGFMDSEHILKYTPLLETGLSSSGCSDQVDEKKGCHKILIVEDNPEVRAYLTSIFEDNYLVVEARNGEEGLEKAQAELPEVIISDVMMPVMDGINFCRNLKKDVKTSHIPVIMLTARTPLIFRAEGLETGADDYITKPFDPKLLELKVRNFIKLREAIRSAFSDNKVLEIEPSKVTLTSTDELFISKALESIEKNMDNPEYTVEDLAEDVCMSRMQLYRKTKALIGQSANEFIRTIRLKRAAQLLELNQLNVAEVTYKVGFSDLKYFRSCFKKQFGVNPSAYSGSEKKIGVD